MPVDFLTSDQNRITVVMLQNLMTCNWRAIFILMNGIWPSLTNDGANIIGWALRFSSPQPVFWEHF